VRNLFRKLLAKQIPIFLFFLAVYDLNTEIRLLFAHFTLTGLFFALRDHMLAFSVLFFFPAIWKNFNISKY
tara:strand:+ start:133 stop:345 length:213 start_codon:yes stop_codon:yes gene_type:complete